MPPLQLAGSELNSTLRLSIQWGPGPNAQVFVYSIHNETFAKVQLIFLIFIVNNLKGMYSTFALNTLK